MARPAAVSSTVGPYERAGRFGRGPGDQRPYGRYRRGRGGVLRFLAFLVVLAALVLLALGTVARPVLSAAIVPIAEGNPGLLRIGFVNELVRENIGSALTEAASNDGSHVPFEVVTGDTPATLAPKLLQAGVIRSERAFLFEARTRDLAPKLTAGRFDLAKNMTPAAVVSGLVDNRILVQNVPVTFREGLRLEQMTAKLMTIPESKVDPKAFYDLVTKPPDTLLADYPWLLDPNVHPKGASLEGFLYPATYTIRVDEIQPTSAEGLVRMMLDAFYERVGQERLDVPKERGLTFYQVLTLASIVEREAVLDEERPLIAGVYQNRLTSKAFPTRLLGSDPTIFYVNDTLELEKLKFEDWTKYVFWNTLPQQLPAELPDSLAEYNTYTSRGLPPGPICSPATPSLNAALQPDMSTGYLYFIAKDDGSGSSAFAKTKAEHDANVAKYGKPKP